MKHKLKKVIGLLLLTVIVSSGFTSKVDIDMSIYTLEEGELCYYVPSESEVKPITSIEPNYYLFLGKSYVGFKEALGFKESRGDYSIINQYGYLGKYQFARTTLQMIGVNNTKNFLEDSRLQEAAFSAYTSRNKWILRRDIKRYEGRYINGVKVTESGILAAAHLGGAGNVKKYLRSGGAHGFEDAFGTSIRYYLKKFSGYDTSHIVPNKQAKANI